LIKKITHNSIPTHFPLYQFKAITGHSFSLFTNTETLRSRSSSFDLSHDSLYIREALYNPLLPSDNKLLFIYNRHFFYLKDPMQPYGFSGGIGQTLGFGAINYLLLFLDKSK